MSLVSVLRQLEPGFASKDIYELSSRGPLVDFLKKKCRTLTCSEYFEGVKPGDYKNGVQCQDVQKLTFPDNSFDICTSTEVFEHVPNDLAGFAEIRRVLKPGGLFLFTVPIFPSSATIERARLTIKGKIEHPLPAQYHRDPNRCHQPVLVFRDYGEDITKRISDQGFSNVQFLCPSHSIPYDFVRTVIAAR
ncbi:MAG: class I SAM-dependent methyltransferase [Desulfobulbaceae bacterium]|nr:class I SAM-dependent methyltransferase [Desulfobulbaceae bacterium]